MNLSKMIKEQESATQLIDMQPVIRGCAETWLCIKGLHAVLTTECRSSKVLVYILLVSKKFSVAPSLLSLKLSENWLLDYSLACFFVCFFFGEAKTV